MEVRCCVCQALIRAGDGSTDAVSHGFCRPCFEREMAKVELWVGQATAGAPRVPFPGEESQR